MAKAAEAVGHDELRSAASWQNSMGGGNKDHDEFALPPLPAIDPASAPVQLSAEQQREYAELGYTLCPQLITPDEALELQAAVDEMLEQARGLPNEHTEMFDFEATHTPDSPRVRRIKRPDIRSDPFRRLLRHPNICGALAQLLGPNVRHQNVKLNIKAADYGSPVEWHQDWAFYPHTNQGVLAAAVMIDDMTEENAPMMVVPKTHLGPIYSHFTEGVFVGGMDVEQAEAEGCDFAAAHPLLGPAGSVSFHHGGGRAVHGSDLNRSPNPRRLVVIECIAADAWPLVDAPADLSVFENQAMFGEPISMVPRLEVAPVRLPFPRRPTGSIYEAQLDIKNKAFARSKDEPAPRL